MGTMSPRKNAIALCMIVLILAVSAGILYVHRVDNSVTAEDRRYMPKYLEGIAPLPEEPTYAQELEFVLAVQRSVLRIAPKNKGIPFGREREPKDLYLSGTGLCYDRSRAIEKVLMHSGFRTRHVAVYSKKSAGSLLGLLKPRRIDSHSVTEVLTRKGWLLVDSNVAWVSTDGAQNPVSVKKMQASAERGDAVAWGMGPAPKIFRGPFHFVYGLYSRHGRFYPPYDFLPDLHYGEFLRNFVDSAEEVMV